MGFVPIKCLRKETLHLISAQLNPKKVIPNDKGQSRDWYGLAELCGIESEKIPDIEKNDSPTLTVLRIWSEKNNDESTTDKLISYLEILDRFDIADDVTPLIEKDAEYYEAQNPSVDKKCSYKKATLSQGIYDAFVLFDKVDVNFAADIIEILENKYGLKLCVIFRDISCNGWNNVRNRSELINKRCKKVIVVLSTTFWKSDLCENFFVISKSLNVEDIIFVCRKCFQVPEKLLVFHVFYDSEIDSMSDFCRKLHIVLTENIRPEFFTKYTIPDRTFQAKRSSMEIFKRKQITKGYTPTQPMEYPKFENIGHILTEIPTVSMDFEAKLLSVILMYRYITENGTIEKSSDYYIYRIDNITIYFSTYNKGDEYEITEILNNFMDRLKLDRSSNKVMFFTNRRLNMSFSKHDYFNKLFSSCELCQIREINFFPPLKSLRNKQCYQLCNDTTKSVLPHPYDLLHIISVHEQELTKELRNLMERTYSLSKDLLIPFARNISLDNSTPFTFQEIKKKISHIVERTKALKYNKSPEVDYQIKILKLFVLVGSLNSTNIKLIRPVDDNVCCSNIICRTAKETILLQTMCASENIKITPEQFFPNYCKFGNFSVYKFLKQFSEMDHFIRENISLPYKYLNRLFRINTKIDYALFCTNARIALEDINLFIENQFFIKIDKCITETELPIEFFNNLKHATFYMFDPNCVNELSTILSNRIEIPKVSIRKFLSAFRLISIDEKELVEKLSELSQINNFDSSSPTNILFDVLFNKLPTISIENYISCKNVLTYANVMNRSQNYLNYIPDQLKIKFFITSKLKHTIVKISSKFTYTLHLLKIQQQLLEKGINEYNTLFLNPEDSPTEFNAFFSTYNDMKFTAIVIPLFGKNYDIVKLKKFVDDHRKTEKIIVFFTDTWNLKKELSYFDEIEETILFNNLTPSTREYILQKKILYNGKNVSIKKLVGSSLDIFEKNLDETTLLNILSTQEIIINSSHKTEGTMFKIERLFRRRKKVLSEKELAEVITTQSNKKIILILGDFGTGKTTVLFRLEQLLWKTNFWVIRFNFSDFVKLFNKKESRYPQLEQLKYFMEDGLEKIIFNLPNKVILLIDEIDKIFLFYPKLSLNCLLDMVSKNNIIKIVITCRQYLAKEIASIAKIDSYILQPISKQDIFYNLENKEYGKYVNKFMTNMNISTIPINATCEYFTMYQKKNTLYDIFISERNKKRLRLDFVDSSVLVLALTNEIFMKLINENIRQSSFNTFKLDMEVFFKLAPLINTEKQQILYRTFAESYFAKHVCHLLKTDNLSLFFVKFLIKHIFLNSNYCGNVQKFINNYLENTSVSKKVQITIGHLIRGIEDIEIVKLAENKLNNILKLLLKPCNKCRINFEDRNVLKYLIENKHHLPNDILNLAIENNLINTVLLIKDQISDWGDTSLHLAVRKNRPEIVKLLLDNGNDVDLTNFFGETPTDIAVTESNFKIAKLLHQRSPKNKKYVSGLLELSVKCDSKNMVTSLLKDISTNTELFPLFTAMTNNNSEISDLLIDHYSESLNQNGSLVHLAVQNNSLTQLKRLTAANCPINTKDINGDTSLHIAVKKNCIKIVKYLAENLKIKLIEDITNAEHETPLHLAVKNNSIEMVELLINKIPNLTDINGDTALHLAVKIRSLELVSLFIKHGHDTSIANNAGKTPLHLSAENGGKKISKMLLENILKRNINYDFDHTFQNFPINEI